MWKLCALMVRFLCPHIISGLGGGAYMYPPPPLCVLVCFLLVSSFQRDVKTLCFCVCVCVCVCVFLGVMHSKWCLLPRINTGSTPNTHPQTHMPIYMHIYKMEFQMWFKCTVPIFRSQSSHLTVCVNWCVVYLDLA